MPLTNSTLWTDQKIDATVNRRFVLDQLKPEEQLLVDTSLAFGHGLTDNTYLDWILERAKRLFLILVDIDLPDQIFGLVDQSYDDGDLPIAFDAVKNLKLSYHPDTALDKRFHKTQFKFLIKSIKEGDHTHYASGDTIPVENLGFRVELPVLGGDSLEKVRLSGIDSKVFAQKKITLGGRNGASEVNVLREVATLKRLKHEHLVSFYASYATPTTAYVLLTPAAEHTLKSFVQDPPKTFEALPKLTRREIIVNWPHCLANGLAWLHSHNQHHGAIRPSNIFIDNEYQICLGQFAALELICSQERASEVEAYQYAPPEKWKRSATVQSSGSAKVSGHSGGRTTRKAPSGKEPAFTFSRPDTSDSRSSGRASAASKSPVLPFDRMTTNSGSGSSMSPPLSTISEGSGRASSQGAPNSSRTGRTSTRSQPPRSKSSKAKETKLPFRNTPSSPKPQNGISDLIQNSPISPYSSSSNKSSNSGSLRTIRPDLPNPIAVPGSDVRAAVVQTWDSDEYNTFFSDIFALGAICIEILSFFCKRSYANFARHRSAKNRTAGRGGGLADSSFHANLEQVKSWCKILEDDAKKRAKKEDGQAFAAVKPMLAILAQCIERDPEHRAQAGELQEQLSDCIWKYANVRTPHCTAKFDSDAYSYQKNRRLPGASLPKLDTSFGSPTSNVAQNDLAPHQIPQIPDRNPRRLHTNQPIEEDYRSEVSPQETFISEDRLPLHYQQFLTSDRSPATRPYVPARSSSRQPPLTQSPSFEYSSSPSRPSNFYSNPPSATTSMSSLSNSQSSSAFQRGFQKSNSNTGYNAMDAHPGKLWDPTTSFRSKLRESAIRRWPLQG
ncbi:MAG: hypothetical protein Q9160_006507 [Pyrenula sp. 1 TL-2023]